MWTASKDFIEFVIILLMLYVVGFGFLAARHMGS